MSRSTLSSRCHGHIPLLDLSPINKLGVLAACGEDCACTLQGTCCCADHQVWELQIESLTAHDSTHTEVNCYTSSASTHSLAPTVTKPTLLITPDQQPGTTLIRAAQPHPPQTVAGAACAAALRSLPHHPPLLHPCLLSAAAAAPRWHLLGVPLLTLLLLLPLCQSCWFLLLLLYPPLQLMSHWCQQHQQQPQVQHAAQTAAAGLIPVELQLWAH